MIDRLPDDILYIVFSHLDSARDLHSLLLANRRLQRTIQAENEGWRIFVRSNFPSISLPSLPSATFTWHQLADSLTWQSRAWERRSLNFQAIMPVPTRNQGPGRRRQEIPFHPALDARFDLVSGEDLVVWGAGENLIGRRRRGKHGNSASEMTTWHRVDGKDAGYVAGPDDIKAVSIVENLYGNQGGLGLLVGRDNGHLKLVDASEENFGQPLADFNPQHATGDEADASQGTINSLDILHRQNLVAAGTDSGVVLYRLPEIPAANISPSTYLELDSQGLGYLRVPVGGLKWMSDDTMVLGLSGCNDPLRYVKFTPSGFEEVATVKNIDVEDKFDISYSRCRLCCGSLTPIDGSSILGGGASNLLLSAWRDGTVRLQDLRTPSNFDIAYCDNIDPWCEFEALLPFGTSHFIGGGAHGATIKIFDFRWPRQYYHTTGSPCGPEKPFPSPAQAFMATPQDPGPAKKRCDHLLGARCRWHELSRDLYHRPNGKFFFSKSLPRANAYAGVWSLARASPMSPNFYIGISGGVVEANLSISSSTSSGKSGEMEVDPTFGYAPSNSRDVGAGYMSLDLDASLMEFGDGLLSPDHDRNVRMPHMRGTGWSRISEKMIDAVPERLRQRHRLDDKYQILTDFQGEDLWSFPSSDEEIN